MDEDGGGALEFRVGAEPAGDGVTGSLVVGRIGVVVFRVQIVVET